VVQVCAPRIWLVTNHHRGEVIGREIGGYNVAVGCPLGTAAEKKQNNCALCENLFHTAFPFH